MPRIFDIKSLSTPEWRKARLSELEQARQSLQAEMYALVADINFHLEKAGLHSNTRGGISPARRNGGKLTLGARVQPGGASLAIRFTNLNLNTRKLTTRTRILDIDRPGASWLVELPEPHRQKILELDRDRRVLNTRYRVLFAELKALQQFDREQDELEAALQSTDKA